MKRLISLLLVIVLVVGLVPTAFADDAATPDVALTLETPKPKTVTVSGESVTYYEIPVKVKNNTSEKITLNAFECYLKFDATGFTPVELMADDGTLIMSASFGSPVSNWSSKTTEKKNDLVLATGAEGKLAVVFLNVPANGATELFKLNLIPVDGIEKGDYPVRFATREEAAAFQAKASGNQVAYDGGTAGKTVYAASENKLDCSATTTISITDGAAPTLASISVSPTSGVYGTAQTFNLTATSTSGKDITSLVDFTVKDASGNPAAFTIDKGTLSIGSNNAGTYTVTATPKKDACQGEEKTATFEITPATITNPTVTVSGFGKGLPVADAKATADNMTVARGWYTGEGVPSEANAATGNFAADSPYTLTLQLIPNKNYKLADDLTVTVKGLGADQVIEHASNPLIVKARTTAKDATSFKGNLGIGSGKTPCYGDTLSQIELNTAGAQAVAYVNGVETVIPGSFTWKDSTEKVGNAGDYRSHTVVFTPSGEYADLYEGFEKNISFYVQKKVLNISGLTWTWSNDTLTYTYTGEPQSIEMNIPTEIAEFVDVTYDNNGIYTNTATNAGSYTAAAVVTPKDANNISLGGATAEEQNSRTITKSWTINKADLTAADKIVTALAARI